MNHAEWRARVHEQLRDFAQTIDDWSPKMLYGAIAG